MSAGDLEREIRQSPTMNERFLLGLLDEARGEPQIANDFDLLRVTATRLAAERTGAVKALTAAARIWHSAQAPRYPAQVGAWLLALSQQANTEGGVDALC